ncbi:MAG TPA: FAD-binding protein [Acidimicrobiales bacterium]|jgi:glycolate oxidase FAD binding subunit|nr:FAD-binding protein [Acidimicrobiales bacterium]
MDLSAFITEVGAAGPVVPVGGGTHWTPVGDGRRVRAPDGIVSYEPAEMVVRVGAGTTVAALDEALAAAGQMVPLDPADPQRATVGGVLAAGGSGLRRLRYGPVRDTLLEARYVSAEGRLVKAGGPVVKNVSGFDLCRLLVGSRGTLGVLAEVVLRVQPRPRVTRWLMGAGDPLAARRRLFRPSSILWDGEMTWVLLEGDAVDVAAEAGALGAGFVDVQGPPALPPHPWSLRPSDLRDLSPRVSTGTVPVETRVGGARFVAEVGIGTVHREDPQPPRPIDPLHQKVKDLFDPTNRLNPGVRVA